MRGLALAVCWILTVPAAAQLRIAEPPAEKEGSGVLEVALSAAEITVGDRLAAELTLTWTGPAPGAAPRFPAWGQTWGRAEVLSAGEVEAFGDETARRVYRQSVVLTAFVTGEVLLPAVSVAVPLAGETVEIGHGDEARFTVRSVLPEGLGEQEQGPEPRPAAPPRPLAAGRRFAWTAGALGGAGLLLVWLLGRRLGEAGVRVPAPAAAEPLAELLERLRRLDPAAAEPAHTGLSLALRGYLGDRLDFPALESTTREIRQRLRATRVGSATAGDAVRLLSDCDQVKFARAPVGEPVTRGRLAEVRKLAREIDRGLRPPPAEAEG